MKRIRREEAESIDKKFNGAGQKRSPFDGLSLNKGQAQQHGPLDGREEPGTRAGGSADTRKKVSSWTGKAGSATQTMT